MYFTSLPDHRARGFDENLHFDKFKKHNVVFKATSNSGYCDRHVGCLSIKTVLSGAEWYGIAHQQLVVRPGQFLILNDDQEYACRVDDATKATILSVFFSKAFAASVLRDASSKEETLLDNFHETGNQSPEFFQTLNPIDFGLQQKLTSLMVWLDKSGYDTDRIDEHLIFLLYEMMRSHTMEVRRASRVMSVKPATRTEIYKRLCMAKDFMHAAFMNKPGLSSIGSAACLSTPQLVRQFNAVFQTTPHQYLTQIRLAHAAELLQHSDAPISAVSLACGFENTSAFCRAFKTKHGVQPGRFRGMNLEN